MALPEEFLQELRMRNDISTVVSGYVRLRRSGRNMVGLCPFHGEKTASFTVYPDTDSFYCFGCGVGGDVISFMCRAENLNYIDAVKLLADRVGMTMPEDSYDDSMRKLRMRIYEANREAGNFFYKQLYSPQGRQGLEYLHGRQLSDQTIRSFGLGFAPDGWTVLTDYLVNKGFRHNELIQANLSVQSQRGNVIDRFRNRVMFPIVDVRGNVIAFGGRIMTDEKPKYLNTSDTPVFKKSNNLFALNKAKNSKSDKLILCEGYMDVIALHKSGFDFAIATLGTALTQEQAVIIKRYTNNVVICYDADEAGQKATARAIEILRKENLKIQVLTVPEGKDPDEYIRKYGENGYIKFKKLLEGTPNDLHYKVMKLQENFDISTAEGKSEYMTRVARLLATLDNEIERENFASEFCEKLNFEKTAFMNQLNKFVRLNEKQNRREEFREVQRKIVAPVTNLNTSEKNKLRGVRAEEALISYLINNPDMVHYVYPKLPPEKMLTEFNRRVYKTISERTLNGMSAMLIDISGEFSQEENSRISAIMAKNPTERETPESCNDFVNIILEEGSRKSAQEIAESNSLEEINEFVKSQKDKINGKNKSGFNFGVFS